MRPYEENATVMLGRGRRLGRLRRVTDLTAGALGQHQHLDRQRHHVELHGVEGRLLPSPTGECQHSGVRVELLGPLVEFHLLSGLRVRSVGENRQPACRAAVAAPEQTGPSPTSGGEGPDSVALQPPSWGAAAQGGPEGRAERRGGGSRISRAKSQGSRSTRQPLAGRPITPCRQATVSVSTVCPHRTG